MDTALKFLFRSESADRILKFLRTRGERARIVAPAWVWARLTSDIPADQPAPLASWSENIVTADPKVDRIWNYVIIAETLERERLICARLSRTSKVKAFGLFDRILPALLCNANGFARGHSVKDLKRYALVCVPRSGSRYFTSMLDRRGLGTPLEHLRDPLAVVITDGKLGFGAAMEALEKFGQRNAIFGTKLISTFLIRASGNNLAELETNVGWLLARGYSLFYIVRPLNETVISSYIAAQLNRWHFFGQLDNSTRNQLDSMIFVAGAVWDEYIRFRAQKVLFDHLAEKFQVPVLSYSDIQSNVDEAVDRVSTQLNVNPANLTSGTASVPMATRHESPTYAKFSTALDRLLEERRQEIVRGTVHQLRALAGVGLEKAQRMATADFSSGSPRSDA